MLVLITACSVSEKTDETNNSQIQNQSEDTKQEDTKNTGSQENENEDPLQKEENSELSLKQEEDSIFDEVDIEGKVIELLEDSFTLSPIKVTEDESGASIAVSEVPGAEKKEDLVTITYSEKTTFEIVTIDSSISKVVSKEVTDKQSIEKQFHVLISGSCQDTMHWIADKITIIQYKK